MLIDFCWGQHGKITEFFWIRREAVCQYEIKNNPVVPAFQLEWVFPDNMDQDEMMAVMAIDMQKKMMQMS